MSNEDRVRIKLLFFAVARELTGTDETELSIRSCTSTQGIVTDIAEVFSAVKILSEGVIISVNQEYCEPNQTINLSQGDEVAIIPPISGG